jgi:hypothetical protein
MRACSEINGSIFVRSKGGVGSSIGVRYYTGENLASSSTTSSKMAIKIFYSLHFCPRKYFSSQ